MLMISPAREVFVFSLKCEEPNIAEVLGLLDPLDFIIDQKISDGSDALWNSSDADDDEVRKEKAFVVGTSLCYYGTMRHTLVLQLRWVVPINTKISYPMIEQLAEFLCPILPPLLCTYSEGGWAGVVFLPARVSSRETGGAYLSLVDEPEACIRNSQ